MLENCRVLSRLTVIVVFAISVTLCHIRVSLPYSCLSAISVSVYHVCVSLIYPEVPMDCRRRYLDVQCRCTGTSRSYTMNHKYIYITFPLSSIILLRQLLFIEGLQKVTWQIWESLPISLISTLLMCRWAAGDATLTHTVDGQMHHWISIYCTLSMSRHIHFSIDP